MSVTCICQNQICAAIIFLRENYAKLLRVVQWIDFALKLRKLSILPG